MKCTNSSDSYCSEHVAYTKSNSRPTDYFADFCLLEMLANFPGKSGAYRQQRYTFFKSECPPKTIKHTALQISQLTKADSWKREKVHVFMTYHNFSQRPQCNAFIQFCSAHIRKFVGTRRAGHDTVKVRREMLIVKSVWSAERLQG